MADRSTRGLLNHLIETCKDGERGFRYAADYVESPSTKALFLEVASQRQQFAADLLKHAQRLGGDEDAGGSVGGALHRGWMTVRDTLTGHDPRAIVAEAERGEVAAAAVYRDALNGVVPATVRDVIAFQYAEIQKTRDQIHALAISVPSS